MCEKCGNIKPINDTNYYRYRNGKFLTTCKEWCKFIQDRNYQARKASRKKVADWVWEMDRGKKPDHYGIPQRVHVTLASKDSEYHKNVERTDTNPRFFNWLCSGSSLEFG